MKYLIRLRVDLGEHEETYENIDCCFPMVAVSWVGMIIDGCITISVKEDFKVILEAKKGGEKDLTILPLKD
jgi:hypothetical protein